MLRRCAVAAVAAGFLALAAAVGCSDEGEPINGQCSAFCAELIDAMDNSDFYDLDHEGLGGTRKACGADCTEVVAELRARDLGGIGDCVDCMAEKGFNQIGTGDDDIVEKEFWTMELIAADVDGPDGDACDATCDRTDNGWDDDGMLIGLFLTDFSADFAEHWSGAEPFCDGYNGDDLCCKESNPCVGLSGNGICECSDHCGWDVGDCGGSDVDTDADTDADTETAF